MTTKRLLIIMIILIILMISTNILVFYELSNSNFDIVDDINSIIKI